MKEYVAVLYKWNGEIEEIEIEEDWIDEIVCAVRSQFYIGNSKKKIYICGSNYSKVEIYKK